MNHETIIVITLYTAAIAATILAVWVGFRGTR